MRLLQASLLFVIALLSACTYGPSEVRSSVKNTAKQPGTSTLAILVFRSVIKEPTGLSAFPDGGRRKIFEQDALVYIYDLKTKHLQKLVTYRDDGTQKESFNPSLQGWKENALYLRTLGCAPTWNWNRGCVGDAITSKNFRITYPGGNIEVVDQVPRPLDKDVLSRTPDGPAETISDTSKTVEVRTRNPDEYHRLVLKPDGELLVEPTPQTP